MDSSAKPTFICVTPVKDEAWILERFLRCASVWADHIVIADQQSRDATREIARQFERVRLIDNPIPRYDEAGRQKLLLEAARKLPLVAETNKRLIMALDADEALTGNFLRSPEWMTVQNAGPGSVICFNWVNIRPNFRSGWIPEVDLPLGYMDDGAEHQGTVLHNWRVPTPAGAPRIVCHDIKILHYQYSDWQRMKSKHRWYQCFERITNQQKSAIDIFRQYHHMYAVPDKQVANIDPKWFQIYSDMGIDMTSVTKQTSYYWDVQIADWLNEHGAEKFAQLDIWQVDYEAVFMAAHDVGPAQSLQDPRTPEQRETIAWLRKTQAVAAVDTAVQAHEVKLKEAGW